MFKAHRLLYRPTLGLRVTKTMKVTPQPRSRELQHPRVPPDQVARHAGAAAPGTGHPGGNPGANLKSISHRCHPILVASVWKLTKETINLPLGRFQSGVPRSSETAYLPRINIGPKA